MYSCFKITTYYARKKLPDPLSLLHLLENQRKTWSNRVKTHTKPIYMNNTTLGSEAVGFEHTLMSFGHANS